MSYSQLLVSFLILHLLTSRKVTPKTYLRNLMSAVSIFFVIFLILQLKTQTRFGYNSVQLEWDSFSLFSFDLFIAPLSPLNINVNCHLNYNFQWRYLKLEIYSTIWSIFVLRQLTVFLVLTYFLLWFLEHSHCNYI